MDPHLKSFDRVAHCYDATRALPPDAATAIIGGIMDVLRTVAASPAVMEVGIGTGRIGVPLAAAGARIVGVDISPAMLARLREKHAPGVTFAMAEAHRLPFAPRQFDAALFVHILHLVPDAWAALRAATEVVHPGGLLVHARTIYSESAQRQFIVRVRELVRELSDVNIAIDLHTTVDRAFREHAEELGAPVTDTELACWRDQTTGRKMLATLKGRVLSNSWAIPDAIMPELLERLTVWTEQLLGDLDSVVENECTVVLVTARLPG